MKKVWIFLLTLKSLTSSTDVTVILGGRDPDGNTIKVTEFFTEKEKSCIHTAEFQKIKHIFNYEVPDPDRNYIGAYVDNDAIFVCSSDGFCHFLDSDRNVLNVWKNLTRPDDDCEIGNFQSYGIDIWKDDHFGFINFANYESCENSTIIASYTYNREKGFKKDSDIKEISKYPGPNLLQVEIN